MKRIFAALLALLLLAGCTTAPSAVSSAAPITPSTVSTRGKTTLATTQPPQVTGGTTAQLPADQAAVLALLEDSHAADIYKDSYQSIFGRITEDGFLQESLTGMYKGEYVRSIGALAILADKVGETEAAGKTLRFVTDVMQAKNLSHVPFTISADGQTVRTEDELDGRAHFVLGWALYIQKSGDTAYFDETYALMKREADAFCSDTYFYEQIGLVRNRRFTHTRVYNGSDYNDVFDILTNTFTASALEQMIAVAKANERQADAVLWETTLKKLHAGIEGNLTREIEGGFTIYREQLYYNNGKPTAEDGVSWVCLSPFVTGYSGLEYKPLMITYEDVKEKLWKDAGNGGYLAVECAADGAVKNWILGKSVGWGLTAASKFCDMRYISKTLEFLNTYHQGTIYMEKMKPSGSGWNTVDPGNAEQVIWFLYGMATLREWFGLSAKP